MVIEVRFEGFYLDSRSSYLSWAAGCHYEGYKIHRLDSIQASSERCKFLNKYQSVV